jgi:hypothetical protein
MKKFYQLKPDLNIIEYNSKTARDAALKAASRSHETIVLTDNEKLFIFDGCRVEIHEEHHTTFTRKNNINFVPSVRKLHYEKLNFECNIKKENDRLQLQKKVHAITNNFDI